MLIEDDPDWRRGLLTFLASEADFEVVYSAGTTDEAVKAIETIHTHVILMDIMLSGEADGIMLTEQGSQKGYKVIMLTSLEQKDMIFAAFHVGAIDYLIKSDFEKIPDKIREVYGDKATISEDAAVHIRSEFQRLKHVEQEYAVTSMKNLLTPSEIQILKLVDQGLTQSQIAEELVISIRTVKVHIGNILKKMNVSSSKDACHKLKTLGVI